MAKKFKLVYDQKGDIKGSYTGIPGEKDPVLIERAVLDGEKAPDPKPAGEKKITKNGKYDVSKFASADVKVEGVKPTGTLDINENGQYDVFNKANVDVNVPQGIFPEGTKEIRNNGEFDITNFEKVNVDVPGATTKELFEATENGTYDIAEYANVKVEVPNPSVGVLDIVANGEYNVAEKAGVNVNVPNPSTGVLSIDANGEYDVTEKAGVNVNVPIPEGYIHPEGSLDITENADNIDVADKTSVNVNVPSNIEDFNHSGQAFEYGSGYWYYFDGDYFTDYTDPSSSPYIYPSEIDVSYKSEGGSGSASMDIGIYSNITIPYRFSGMPSYDSHTWYQGGKRDYGYYIEPDKGSVYVCPNDDGDLNVLKDTSYDENTINLTSLEVNEEVEFSFDDHTYKITRLD